MDSLQEMEHTTLKWSYHVMADNIHMQLHYKAIVKFRIWIKLFSSSQKGKILYRKFLQFYNFCQMFKLL